MEQGRLQEKTEKIQEERIREMEQVISLLERENSLQKQLIEKLEEENRTLQEQAWKYLETMRQMLKIFIRKGRYSYAYGF